MDKEQLSVAQYTTSRTLASISQPHHNATGILFPLSYRPEVRGERQETTSVR